MTKNNKRNGYGSVKILIGSFPLVISDGMDERFGTEVYCIKTEDDGKICGLQLRPVYYTEDTVDIPTVEDGDIPKFIVNAIHGYFAGKRINHPEIFRKLLTEEKIGWGISKQSPSEFTYRVLGEICRVPYGQTVTYGEIARNLGTRGFRAVGRVLSTNPYPILIPCHRAVGRNGPGGFMGVKGPAGRAYLYEITDKKIEWKRIPAEIMLKIALLYFERNNIK